MTLAEKVGQQGRPRIVSRFVDDVQAVLEAGLPGMEGGRAIANIIFGEVNPSARLTYSYPRHPYDHKMIESNSYDPQWEFGHGLSYMEFSYFDLFLPRCDRISESISAGLSQVPDAAERNSASMTAMFITDSSRERGSSVSPRIAFEKISPCSVYWSHGSNSITSGFLLGSVAPSSI
jgi:beta-glucosidase